MIAETELLPPMTAMHKRIDTSPEAFGFLEDSNHLLHTPDALRAKMEREGYLYLPGYLNRADVLAARQVMADRLDAEGLLDPAYPTIACKAHPTADIGFKADLAKDNHQLMNVIYGERTMSFFDLLLGGPARHYDFTWVRAVSPGNGTPPHMDVVYMGRGTKRLYTAWIPFGDVPLTTGGLLVLERSHRHDRLNNGYGSKDVDTFCENKVGDDYTGMGGGGNIAKNGWLSKDPIKLRRNLGGRWLSANYRAGDLLVFSVFTVHTSLDNHSDEIRLSTDTRYQLASEPIDERWIGDDPIAHGPKGKRGKIC
jgi:Phytanoyl-CoA dioxygenase (PhyH)